MNEHEPRPYIGSSEVSSEPDNYRVNSATRADLEKLRLAFPPPEDDPEQHEFCLTLQEQGETKFFVLWEDNNIVGCANLHFVWQSDHDPAIRGPYIDGFKSLEVIEVGNW